LGPKRRVGFVTKRTKPPSLLAAALLGSLLLVALPSAAYAQGGSLDPTFGGDGKVTTNFTSRFDTAYGVLVQPGDGKIVAAGRVAGSGGRFGLARYNPDGSLDATFGGDGKVTTNFTTGFEDAAFDVVLQADGKIVAAGVARDDFALARYNADGSLDTSFGGDGKVTTDFAGFLDAAFGVAIQPADGKIVAAGMALSVGRLALARYNTDGTLDTSFSGDGRVTTNFTRGDDLADHLAIQADGKIVAAGTAGSFSRNARFALARYNGDGTLDTTFSENGKVTTEFTSHFDGAFAVAIQPADQKIVAVGRAAGTLGVARYATGGTLDSTFSGNGKVRTNFTAGIDYADDVAIQSNGKIVAAGSANFSGSNSKFALARYNGDGTLDATFGGDGLVKTNFTPGDDNAFGVAIQPLDGKIVAAGRAAGGGNRFALARYFGT
jgi:uncharacterized delta-60 repeat protein